MAGETNSTNMGMPIPGVGSTAAPTWASDLNSSLNIIDLHDHTVGNGVAITPSGININADLAYNGNSFNTLKKAAFTSQSAALTGTNFLTFVSGNLYVNDGSGNQIPITSAGGVAGSPGSIGSLASPAAATYTAGSKTFSWTADSGKSAAMDNGAVTIRETNVASAKGITLASPSSLAADYQITLLTAVPASTQALNISSSGNMGTITYDNIGVGMTSTGANAIGVSMTSTGANPVAASRTRATGTSVAAGGVAISTANALQTNSSASAAFTDITNLTVTIVTSGRPVFIGMISSSTSTVVNTNGSFIGIVASGANGFSVAILRGASVISMQTITGNNSYDLPVSSIFAIDTPGAGTYTYKAQWGFTSGTRIEIGNVQLVAYEL